MKKYEKEKGKKNRLVRKIRNREIEKKGKTKESEKEKEFEKIEEFEKIRNKRYIIEKGRKS